MGYLWLKALHIIAVISWMAGMLYLPRLFVYHAGVSPSSPEGKMLETMEYRLLRYIMTPALVVVWGTGLWLAFWAGFFTSPWLHGKLMLVLAMSGLHGYFSKTVKTFANEANAHTGKFFRILNEVPTLLMVVIVILVVVKPFS